MQKLVFVNGAGDRIDLTSGDYGITEWEGFSADDLNIQSQQVPFQDGSVFLDALMEQRELSVTVAMQDNNDLEKRYRLRRQMIATMNPKLGEGLLIYTNDFLSKQIHVIPQIPLFQNKNSNDSGTPKVSCSFTACNPYWEDLEDTIINFNIIQQPIIKNEGDVPCQIEMEWFTSYVKNPMVINTRTNKKIGYSGELTENLIINTNIGKKSANASFFNIDIVGGTIDLLNICSENGLYLIGCDSGLIMVSKDGYNWSLANTTEESSINSIRYLDGSYYAVGNYSLLSSVDGFYWSGFTFTERINATDVTYAKHLNQLFYSTLGYIYKGYSPAQPQVTQGNFNKMAYSESLELIIAVGNGGLIKTSSDGDTWTEQTSNVSVTLFDVIWIEEKEMFVAVGASGTVITSPDGMNWTTQTSGISADIKNVIFTSFLNDIICACENGKVLISYNYVSFSSNDSILNQLNGIAYNQESGELFGIGDDFNIIRSYDFTNWDFIKEGLSVVPTIMFYDDKLEAYIGKSTNNIYKSSDLQNWEQWQINYTFNKIIYSEYLDLYIGVGNNGLVATSEDLETWTQKTSGINVNLNNVISCDKLQKIVAIGNTGTIITSSDCQTWSTQSSGVSASLYKIKYNNDYIMIMIGSGSILTSQDCENWNFVAEEIRTIVEAIDDHKRGCDIVILKVIVETCCLTEWQIKKMCQICAECGADYIKTSTGFAEHGATPEAVSIMKEMIDRNNYDLKIKASGGIRTLVDAKKYIDIGADRIGASNLC